MASRPFRFTAQVPDLTGAIADWRDELSRLEHTGFSTVALADVDSRSNASKSSCRSLTEAPGPCR